MYIHGANGNLATDIAANLHNKVTKGMPKTNPWYRYWTCNHMNSGCGEDSEGHARKQAG